MVNLILLLLRRGWRSPWAAFVATPCAPLKFKSFPQVHATGEFGTWNLVVFGVGQDDGVVFCWVVCHKMLVIYTPGTLTWNPGMKGLKQWCSFSKGWSSGSILVFWGVPILKNTSLLGCNNHRTQLKGCNDRKRRFRRIFKPTAAVFTTTSMTDFQVHPVGLLPRICIPGMRGSCAKDPPGETATKKWTYR